MCHGATGPAWARCYSCNTTRVQVSHPISLVVPISLTLKDGQFYHVLKAYKNPWGAPAQRLQMAALFARFFSKHGDCIRAKAGMDWNAVTIVPSSGQRQGPHPLGSVLTLAPNLGPQYQALLAKGPTSIGHNQAADGGYQVTTDVTERRVVLIDDTFTTGGRVQSAASALRLAGAQVVAVIVAGRIIDPRPEFPPAQELWDQQRAKEFTFDTCCLCATT